MRPPRLALLLCLLPSLLAHADPATPPVPMTLPPKGDPAPAREAPRGARRFGVDDLLRIERVSDAQLSPDGKRVCFVRTVTDPDKNLLRSALWLAPLQGGPPRQLTFPPANRPDARDQSPRFSPDGQRLAFTSNRDGSSQLYLLDLAGGEAQKLTSLAGGAAEPVWAPDGRSLLVQASVFADCPPLPEGAECNRRRAEGADQGPSKARVIERLMYRHWDAWYDGRRGHLIRVPAGGGGGPVDLTPGDLDAPALARAGDRPYVLSPDGKELAVVQNRDKELSTSTNNDIFLLPQGGDPRRARAVNLTEKNRATDGAPRYSPDGRYLAYLAQRRPGFEGDRTVLWLYDRRSGQRRALTEELDAHAGAPVWAPDSQRLYFPTSLSARPRIYAVALSGGRPFEVATVEAHDLQVTPDGAQLVFTASSLSRAAEVYRLPLQRDGSAAGAPVAVTGINDGLWAAAQLGKQGELWTQTKDGRRMHSWLLLPPGFEPGRRYPAVVLIHGGPQGAWEDSWHYRWNPQVYAGAGYVVLMPNPRGSEGFGQQFLDEVSGDWGGRAYDDVMRATDQLAAQPYVDGKRIGALGASYGGYMVNWIAGHTDRFAALVTHDGVYDLRSMQGETEEQWFTRWEMGGDPWESDQYDRFSPSRFAGKMKTPMLVITNERDYRVPVGQGMQLFTALKLRGVPSKMLIFPDENHWVLKPGNSRLWYATVLDWLHRYLGGAAADDKVLRQAAVHAG